jgi:chromosome segregation ATPase
MSQRQNPLQPSQLKSLEVQELEARTRLEGVLARIGDAERKEKKLKDSISAMKERERNVAQREYEVSQQDTLVKAGQARVAVLKKQVAHQDELLKNKLGEFVVLERKVNDANAELQRINRLTTEAHLLSREKQAEMTNKRDALRKELQAIKDEIAERSAYREEQEELIAKAVEQGNIKLTDLTYEIIDAEQAAKVATEKRVTTETELNEYIFTTQTTIASFTSEEKAMEQELENLNNSLVDVKNDVNKAQQHYKKVIKDTDDKLRTLKEEETRIIAIREASAREREELNTDKRRWASTKALYDIQ